MDVVYVFHIIKIDKNKYDEYIWHNIMCCVHYHILLSNICQLGCQATYWLVC